MSKRLAPDRRLVRRWRSKSMLLALGAGLLAVGWFLLRAQTDAVPGWEQGVFLAINRLPDWLWPLLWPVMQLGNFWVFVPAGAVLLVAYRRIKPAVAATIAVIASWLLAKLVKQAADRGRPEALLDDVEVRDTGVDPDGLGFVSGHTAIAFGLATVVAFWLPMRWRWTVFAAAAGVGFARIYAGAHLPLDVIGGAGLGVMVGALASMLIGVPGLAKADVEEPHVHIP